MNYIDHFDWDTLFLAYRPEISTDDSCIIEKFDTFEQAELYAAVVGGEAYRRIATDYSDVDAAAVLVYESSTGQRLRLKVI